MTPRHTQKSISSHSTTAGDNNFGNARDVRNFFEDVVSVHSDRVSSLEKPTRDDLMTFTADDLDKAAGMG